MTRKQMILFAAVAAAFGALAETETVGGSSGRTASAAAWQSFWYNVQ